VFIACGKHVGVEDARQGQQWGGGFKYRREVPAFGCSRHS